MDKLIVFTILLEYVDGNGIKKYDTTTLHEYMEYRTEDEWVKFTEEYCGEISKKQDSKYKWIVLGHCIVDL